MQLASSELLEVNPNYAHPSSFYFWSHSELGFN